MSDSTAITAPARKPLPEIITTKDEFNEALDDWRSRQFNVLSPFTTISGLAAQHGLIASVCRINPDPSKGGPGEVYDGLPFLKKGEEVALAKIALRKIAECGGISTTTTRTDDRRIPNYWEFKAVASYRGIDGALVVREATCEWDLRDGSARLSGWTSSQISEGRKNGLRNCEARAINAAIRECGTGLKQKYTKDELKKPFVILRVMFQPDMSDPDTRRLVTERSMAGSSILYPAAAQLPSPAPMPIDDGGEDEPREKSAGRGSSSAPAAAEYPDGFGLLQSVRTEQKARRSDGGTFPKWSAVDHAGVEYVTVKPGIGKVLEQHYQAKTPVQLIGEENGYGELEVIEITPLQSGDKPLPRPEDL